MLLYNYTDYSFNPSNSGTRLNAINLQTGEDTVVAGALQPWVNPVFAPDGESYFFVWKRYKKQSVNRFNLKTGKVTLLFEFAMGVNNLIVSPDGKKLAFTAKVYDECRADDECNEVTFRKTYQGTISAHLADKLFVRHWDEYEDDLWSHIFVYNLETKKLTDVTPVNITRRSSRLVVPAISPFQAIQSCDFCLKQRERYCINHQFRPLDG